MFLAVAMVFATLTVTTPLIDETEATQQEVLFGHIRDELQITIFDALEVLKYLVGMDGIVKNTERGLAASLITEQSKVAGEPSIFDVLEILKFLVGMPGILDTANLPRIVDIGAIENLIARGTVEVIQDEFGNYRVIDGAFIALPVESEEEAAAALNASAGLFKNNFRADSQNITVQSVDTGGQDESHFYRYSSTVNDIPVLGSEIILTTNKNGIVRGMFSSYNDQLNSVNTYPTITSEQAADFALSAYVASPEVAENLDAVAAEYSLNRATLETEFLSSLETEGELMVYADDVGITPALVWAVSINTAFEGGTLAEIIDGPVGDSSIVDLDSQDDEPSQQPTEFPGVPFVSATSYIYANGYSAGEVLTQVSNILGWTSVNARANDLLNNSRIFRVQHDSDTNKFRFRDAVRNVETYKPTYSGSVFNRQANLPGELVQSVSLFGERVSKAAVSAHANTADAFDFYRTVLGRNSYDNRGKKVVSSIELPSVLWNQRINAFWWPGGQQFGYVNNGKYESAKDVVGHEFTHAVINYVVGNGDNVYLGSPNYRDGEGGALNEAYADIMGSFVEGKTDAGRWSMGEDMPGTPMRDMSNRRHYREFGNNNACCHTNSGIFSHAAFLMMTDSRTSGIAPNTWARVFYRSLYRLTVGATFLDARGAVVAAAKAQGFNSTQQTAIKQAFDDVGIVETESIRIVLRWGEQPWDLDSHLTGPAVGGNGRFHTWYSNRNYFASSDSLRRGLPAADLDYDDTSSWGPEVTTIRTLTPGDYHFYIHDYTNLSSSSSTAMANSGANVSIFIGSSRVAMQTFEISTSSEGTLWHVFTLNIDSDGIPTVTPVNAYSYHSDPGSIGGGATPVLAFNSLGDVSKSR